MKRNGVADRSDHIDLIPNAGAPTRELCTDCWREDAVTVTLGRITLWNCRFCGFCRLVHAR